SFAQCSTNVPIQMLESSQGEEGARLKPCPNKNQTSTARTISQPLQVHELRKHQRLQLGFVELYLEVVVRIAVVQLSDIHFQASSNVLVSRVEKIVAAIRPTLQQVQGLVFAVTGDVAYSGEAREYDVAFEFFTELKAAIAKADPALPVEFVFIPGNHDCNFRSDGEVRSALLAGLPEKIETLDPQGEIVRQVGAGHDDFFSFEARFE